MNTLFSEDEMKQAEVKPEENELPIGQCKLPKEIVDFSDLSLFEQQLLCFYAYLGRGYNYGKIKIFAHRRDMLMSEINEVGAEICRKGYLTYPWGSKSNFNNYEIKPRYHFRIILFLLDCHPEWLQEFETIGGQIELSKRIFRIISNLYNERIDLLQEEKPFLFYESYNDSKYYATLLRYPFFAPYSLVVSEDMLMMAVSQCVTDDYVNDNLQEQYLMSYEIIADCANKKDPQVAIPFLNTVRVYRFLLTGKLLHEDLSGWTIEMFAAKAFQSLYKGNAELATRMLERALEMHNQVNSEKNIILNPILAFFQILYYYKQPLTAQLKKKVASIAKKKTVAERPEMMGVWFAAHHLILNDRAEYRKEDLKALKATKLPLNNQLYQLFTGIFADAGCEPIKSLPPSTCALLRHEQSSVAQVADADDLASLLGGNPLLQAVEHKAAWEVVFEELVGSASAKQTTATAESRPDRLAYVWNGYGWMPQRQKWLRSGRWGSPSQMGFRSFIRGEVDCMSDIDRQSNYRIVELQINRDYKQYKAYHFESASDDSAKDLALFMALLTEEYGGDASEYWKKAF